jgi:hypothetical protein
MSKIQYTDSKNLNQGIKTENQKWYIIIRYLLTKLK